MRGIEARYEDGVLKPTEALSLRPGERVRVIVFRHPDPSRWDVERLKRTADGEDLDLAQQGLLDWAERLDREDKR